MRQLYILFFFCSIVIGSWAQTQLGVAYRYNGKKARTPLGNVTISYDTNKRTTISGEQDGVFSLTLTGQKMGDRIGLVTIKKREMMVFNQHAVDEWSVRKEPLMLILCNADEFEKQKENLINIGKREAKKKYDRLKEELETKLNASQIKEAEYEAALDKAYEELERLQKNIGEYADLFARIDESEIDTLAQRAVELFNQGNVESAILLFEQGNYMEKLREDSRAIQQADQIISKTQKAKEKAQQDREAHVRSLKAQIEAYKMQNEWQKAGQLLKGLADELQTLQDVQAYARFCLEQQEFDDAKTYYLKYLAMVESDNNHSDYQYRMSVAYVNLGVLFQRLKHFDESENYLKKSLQIRQSLLSETDNTSIEDLATSYNDIGGLYRELNRFDDAERMFQEAVRLRRKLYQRSEAYAGTLGTSLNNLGTLYWDKNKLEECEKCYDEALNLHRKNAADSVNENVAELASTLDNMASLNLKKRDFSKCEQLHLEALALRRHLVTSNPQAFSDNLAYSLGNLGNLYQTMGLLDKSIPMYEEALDIFRQLSEKYPLVYQTQIAMTQMNIGVLYMALGNMNRSIELLEATIATYQEMAKHKSGVYEPNIAMTLVNLGMAYDAAHRYDEGKEVLDQATKIYGRLAEKTPAAFNFYYAYSLNTQASNSIFQNRFADAERQARQAVDIEASQVIFQTNLAVALLLQGDYAEAEKIYRQYKDKLKDAFLDDFKQFTEAGVIPKKYEADVEKIKKLLESE